MILQKFLQLFPLLIFCFTGSYDGERALPEKVLRLMEKGLAPGDKEQ